jgi:hypothetical protein
MRGVASTIAPSATLIKQFEFVRPMLVPSACVAYGKAVSAELSRRREKVMAACQALRTDPRNSTAVQQISTCLHDWEEVARPMQVFEAHMSREEREARELYLAVRDLCLWLANERGEYRA